MNVEERTQALLALVEQYRQSKCRELIDPAAAAARTTVADALGAARRRVRTAIAEERAHFASRVAAAEAQLATHRRSAQQRHAAGLIAQGWQLLPAALAARWNDAVSRQRWVEHHLAQALTALPKGEWEIEHPALWPNEEQRRASGWLAERGVVVRRFAPDERIAGGFRIRAGANIFDATLEGLLADRLAVSGRMLHHFEEASR